MVEMFTGIVEAEKWRVSPDGDSDKDIQLDNVLGYVEIRTGVYSTTSEVYEDPGYGEWFGPKLGPGEEKG
jgi:hypothetical protein